MRVLLGVLLILVVLLALVLADRENDSVDVHVQATSELTPTTTWPAGPPTTLPAAFDPAALAPKPARPKVRHRTAPTTARVVASGDRRGVPCGGDMPPCGVLDRESMMTVDPIHVYNDQVNADGDAIGCYYPVGYAGDNPCGSTASGPWQILRSTWNWFGGYLNAADAPLAVQIEKVRKMWNHGRGCGQWAACG
jgi:hypothetical protein